MDAKIRRLLKDLTNVDDDLRALATMTLMKLEYPEREDRKKVLTALIATTKDKNIAVRFFARKAIDKIKKTESLLRMSSNVDVQKTPIEERLCSDDYQQRISAILQIKENNDATMKSRLIEMLNTEEHPFVKAAIVSTIPIFLEKSEAELLSPFLSDEDNRVRSNTIEAMEYLKAEQSIPALFTALSDRDNRIRAVAAKALQSFGEEKVFTELKKMLDSNEDWMKVSAIYAISHIQASEAIIMLLDTARSSKHTETRLKAIIALANYYDSTSYGFLKQVSLVGEEPFKEAGLKALKLIQEKFGEEPPTSTLIESEDSKTANNEQNDKISTPGKPTDIADTVSRFFRKGRDEAVGLSQRSAINFAVTDLEKELSELQKEIGKIVFVMYQGGNLGFPDLLSIGHEILRMNYFIDKYNDEESKKEKQDKSGFFYQLKNLFSNSEENKQKESKAARFYKKRDELYIRMGKLAIVKCEKKELQHKAIDGYVMSYQNLKRKLSNQKKKLEAYS